MEEHQYIFKRYQTRPATVRAVRVPGGSEALAKLAAELMVHVQYGCLSILTERGTAVVRPGEWVIMDEDSHELYWMTDAEFKSQYSEVEE